MSKSLWSFLFSLIILTATVVGLIYYSQENLIFYPKVLPPDFQYSWPGRFDELNWTVDGATINALHFKAEQPKGVVLYFHGNAGSLGDWGYVAPEFTKRGYDVLIPDYRGFGKSTGRIESEAQLHQDAAVAYTHLRKFFPENQIIVYGRSIGSGLAVHLAKNNRPRLMILESPFFSMIDLAKYHYSLIPRSVLNLVVKYPLRIDLWMPDVACPVYLFHGTQDNIVTIDASERLSGLIRTEHRLIAIPGGDHNNLGDFPLYQDHLDRILR